MKRGEIYFIKSNYREEGSEQRGDRPAVIVSNDKNNENSEVVEIAYMTTKPKTDLPTHVFTRSADRELIRLETERDLYKKFNEDLLDILKKGAKA